MFPAIPSTFSCVPSQRCKSKPVVYWFFVCRCVSSVPTERSLFTTCRSFESATASSVTERCWRHLFRSLHLLLLPACYSIARGRVEPLSRQFSVWRKDMNRLALRVLSRNIIIEYLKLCRLSTWYFLIRIRSICLSRLFFVERSLHFAADGEQVRVAFQTEPSNSGFVCWVELFFRTCVQIYYLFRRVNWRWNTNIRIVNRNFFLVRGQRSQSSGGASCCMTQSRHSFPV